MKKNILFLVAGWLLFLCLLSYPLNAEEEVAIIEDIKIELIKDTPQIKIASNIAIDYLDYTLEQPPRIIIDPLGIVYCNLEEEVFSGENLVRAVSVVKARGRIPPGLNDTYYPLDFIVIEMKKPVYYDVVREEKLIVKLGKEIPPPAPVVKKLEEITVQPRIEITEVVEPKGEIEKEFLEGEEEELVGKEFFDEEKFPLVERYKIEAGDELEISVWQHPDLFRTVFVRPDGFVSFPLTGDIKADGLTAERLAREIALRLSRVLRKPEVSVIVKGFRSKGIFVLGAVNKPGLYPHETKMTVLRAVTLADSWQPQSDLKSILVVKRFFTGDTEVIRVNLWDVIKNGDVKKDIALQAGDIVYVPQSFIGNLGAFLDGLRFKFGTGAHYTID